MNRTDERSGLSAAAVHRLILVSGVVLAAFVAAALFVFDPATWVFYPLCPFHAVTGLHCPGCGSLRAAHQLLHGNFLAALGRNPLMVLALPFLGYGFVSYGVSVVRKKRLPGASVPAFWIWALLAVILAYWVLRNIPVHPFTLLAP